MSDLTVCPRCEGQKYDVGSCGLCDNTGWIDENGDPAGTANIWRTILRGIRRGQYSDRAIRERRARTRKCICPSHASNAGQCPVHDEKGRVREAAPAGGREPT